MYTGRIRVFLLVAVAAFASAFFMMADASAMDLRVSGNRFTVDGTPRFLVFVSYFDAMDASEANVDFDFSQLRAWGVDGIRIFPNWWTWVPATYPGDTLIDPAGHIRETIFLNMVWYLDRAREHGLLVDISFSAETVAALCGGVECPSSNKAYASLTVEEARQGIQSVAQRLVGPNYRHVMFDIQNESSIIGPLWKPLSNSNVASIVQAVKSADPSRIVMASVEQSKTPLQAGQRANATGQDVVAYHEPHFNEWWNYTYNWVRDLRAASGKPIYLQEPLRYKPDENAWWYTAAGLQKAVKEAKRAGAAAWTFHTSAGFYMNQDNFIDQLALYPEREFLSSFKAGLDQTPWGI